ncbi:hypothetical protein F3Y22_tig00111701pilonHSYRG00017 [Hibiscus syriacus]|uniref:Uncharacterized protein n=1 Tax=Hibiscus syriacus TaxID=106335 RepID=A0A6A2XHN4_HIBSY|nr:hypothetical protein F3Y22_tig00111701pilonHSYRG00017 [Hibiscus syriacus]
MSATASPTAKSKRSDRRGFWKAMKHVFVCFNPITSSNSRRKENAVVAMTSMNSNFGSPLPDHAYSAMNAEERDENLKLVITYCNNSMMSAL